MDACKCMGYLSIGKLNIPENKPKGILNQANIRGAFKRVSTRQNLCVAGIGNFDERSQALLNTRLSELTRKIQLFWPKDFIVEYFINSNSLNPRMIIAKPCPVVLEKKIKIDNENGQILITKAPYGIWIMQAIKKYNMGPV